DRVRIGPDNWLHVGVDVADKTAVAHVRSWSADADNVTGRANSKARKITQCDVDIAGSVVKERGRPIGRVAGAAGIAKERCTADGRVLLSVIGKKRITAHRCVEGADKAASERTSTVGRIEDSV